MGNASLDVPGSLYYDRFYRLGKHILNNRAVGSPHDTSGRLRLNSPVGFDERGKNANFAPEYSFVDRDSFAWNR
jgi:hypothetical protein